MSDIENSIEDAEEEIDREKEIERLSKLSPIDYDQMRKQEAGRLNIQLKTLDSEVEKRRKAGGGNGNPDRQGRFVELTDPEPWPEPVDGAQLFDDILATIRRFVFLPDGAAETMALWIIHAHAHDAAFTSPLLAFTSPEKRCGKTTALKVLQRLVPKPLPTSNITAAAVFRSIEKWGPTLLVDEADTFLRDSDELRGVLNSGHSRDQAYLIRCEGDSHEPVMFHTWAPKAIAMIGNLPDTLDDRSLGIRMSRKTSGERVEILRPERDYGFDDLLSQCARWSADNIARLKACDPAAPATLHDRAADNWRPLLAIADIAGGHWPDLSRSVAMKVSAAGTEDGSIRIQLLSDIQTVFAEKNVDRLSSSDLCVALAEMEDRPWAEWGRTNKPITAPS